MKGVAEGVGVTDDASLVAVTGGGGVAPFCPPPQLTVSRSAVRRNRARRTMNTP
jgi:hypothetical protein